MGWYLPGEGKERFIELKTLTSRSGLLLRVTTFLGGDLTLQLTIFSLFTPKVLVLFAITFLHI